MLWNFFCHGNKLKHTHTVCFCAPLQITQPGQLNMHANPIHITISYSHTKSPAPTWPKLLKSNTSVWLYFPPPYSSSMFVKKTNIQLQLCKFPPVASHHVITVVYWDRGWARVLYRGHLTAPTPSKVCFFSSFICQYTSSYVFETCSTGLS